MSDFDILTKFLKYSDEEAQKMISRNKLQKLEELRMQIIASNPQLLGVGLPGPDEQEIGTEPGGPSPMLGDEEQPPEGEEGGEGAAGMPPAGPEGGPEGGPPPAGSGATLPEPSEKDIKKYDLEIKDYSKEMDREEIDRSTL